MPETADRNRPIYQSENKSLAKDAQRVLDQAAAFDSDTGIRLTERYRRVLTDTTGATDHKRLIIDTLSAQDEAIRTAVARQEAGVTLVSGYLEAQQFDASLESFETQLQEQGITLNPLQKGLLLSARSLRKKHRYDACTAKLTELRGTLDGTEQAWNRLLSEKLLPPELSGDLTTVVHLIDIQRTLKSVERHGWELTPKERRLLRAKALTPHLDHVSPALVRQLVETDRPAGTPELMDLLAGKIHSSRESGHRLFSRLTKTQKRILIAMSGAVILGVFGLGLRDAFPSADMEEDTAETTPGVTDEPTLTPTDRPTATPTDRPTERPTRPPTEIPPTATPQPTITAAVEGGQSQGGGSGSGGSPEQGSGGSSERPQQPDSQQSITPDNAGEFPETVSFWRITGDIPDTYFRTATARSLNRFAFAWDTQQPSTQTRLPLEGEAATVIESTFAVEGGYIEIPVPYGYRMTWFSPGDPNVEAYMYRSPDNVYRVYLGGRYTGEGLRYGLVRDDAAQAETVADPSQYLSTEQLVGERSSWPPEVRSFLDQLQAADLSTAEKADRIGQFLMTTFTYSRDPRYSSYYLDGADQPGGYLHRAFELLHGDCDVVNTMNVAMLRDIGIPSRMAFGYANSSDMANPSRQTLDNTEGHGWAEFWDAATGQWVASDATPTSVDEYTAALLNEVNGGRGVTEVTQRSGFDDATMDLRFNLLSFRDFYLDNRTLLDSTLALSAYIATLTAALRWRRRQRGKIEAASGRSQTRIAGANYGDIRKKVGELVTATVDVPNYTDTARNTPEAIGKFLLSTTQIPLWVGNLKRMRRMEEHPDIMGKTPQPRIHLPAGETSAALSAGLGVPEQMVESDMVIRNYNEITNHGYRFSGDFGDNVRAVHNSLGISEGTRVNLDRLLTRSTNLTDFVDRVTNSMYQQYRVDWKREKNRREHLRKSRHKKDQEELAQLIPFNETLLTYKEFTLQSMPALRPAIVWWELNTSTRRYFAEQQQRQKS